MPIARHYAFTVWPKHLLQHNTLEEWFDFAKAHTAGITYIVMQHEHGTNEGGHHVQGFVTGATKKRPVTLGNHYQVLPEVFQVMRRNSNAQKNRAYCTDDSKRVPGTWFFEYGTVPTKKVNKVTEFIKQIEKYGLKRAMDDDPTTYVRHCNGFKDLDMHYKRKQTRPEVCHVIAIMGPPGSGKSWWAKKLFDPGHSYTLPAVPRSGQAWFDMYEQQRTLIIDEFSGRIEFELFKNMLDPLEMLTPTKGSHGIAMWDTVIITTNFHPSTWYGNDIDSWGTEVLAPVQRRIHTFIEATGVYNAGTQQYVVSNWENGAVSPVLNELPTRVHFAEQNPDTPSEEDAAEVAAEEPVPLGSNAVLPSPPPDQFDTLLEELEQDWEMQDNDFLLGLNVRQPGPDPDSIIDGGDGDTEPTRGINIDPSKDVY